MELVFRFSDHHTALTVQTANKWLAKGSLDNSYSLCAILGHVGILAYRQTCRLNRGLGGYMTMRQQIKLMGLLLFGITAVLLTACVQVEPPPTLPLVNESMRIFPTSSPLVVEVTVEIATPEPTLTTAVCTPLPEGMHIHIRREEDLFGVIEVEGLLSDDKPIVILTGEALASSFREESTAEAVEADGRYHRIHP